MPSEERCQKAPRRKRRLLTPSDLRAIAARPLAGPGDGHAVGNGRKAPQHLCRLSQHTIKHGNAAGADLQDGSLSKAAAQESNQEPVKLLRTCTVPTASPRYMTARSGHQGSARTQKTR